MASIDLNNEETINVSLSEPEKINTGVKNTDPINIESSDGWYEKKYEEIDPIFSSSVASTISNDDIERWNSGKDIPENLSEFVDDLGDNPVHTHHQYLTEHQDISTKQDILVSGTNIKTINNQSLLGSGNITIQGGGSGGGDMYKSTYDTNDNGVVDNAEKVNNHTVEKDVPPDAKFTDTVYDDTSIIETLNNKAIIVVENLGRSSSSPFVISDHSPGVYQFQTPDVYIKGRPNDESFKKFSLKDCLLFVTKQTTDNNEIVAYFSYLYRDFNPFSSNPGSRKLYINTRCIKNGSTDTANCVEVNRQISEYYNEYVFFDYDFTKLVNRPDSLSDFTDDLGTSPAHTHSQYLTEHQDISNKADKSEIPKNTSDLTNDSGFVKNTDYANADTGGVVKLDSNTYGFTLSGANKLMARNDAYSTYLTKNNYYVISKGTLENVITGKQLVNQTDLNTKQDSLISGSNIKTINGNSVLGNGDITVEEGASLVKYIVTDSMSQSELNAVGQEILDAYNDGKSYGRDYVVYLDTAYYHGTCPGFILLGGFLKFYSGAYFTSPLTQQDYSMKQRLSRYILQVDISSATTMIIDDLIGKSSYLSTDPDEYYSDINYYTPTYKSQPVSKGYLNDRENKLLTAFGLDTDTYDETSTYAVGDLVVYDNTIYECITAVSTAEAWDSSKWEIVPIIVNE